jgi:hypothetical protein
MQEAAVIAVIEVVSVEDAKGLKDQSGARQCAD